jgi:subtilisin family serine protease
MRVRTRIAPGLARAALALIAACLASTPAFAQQRLPLEDLERGLSAAANGQELPLPNRPLPRLQTVHERLLDRPRVAAEPKPFVAPEEFGVILEYDGGRTALEAAGVRVQTQVGSIFTARMRRSEIANLRTVRGLKSARLAKYTRPNLNVSRVDVNAVLENGGTGVPPVYNGRAGRGMIIGDIDSGIDFTRPDFADSLGKTRILYIWDQTDLVGPGPAGFGYGSEWTKTQIDNTPGSVRQVDDDGHGTAVAGVLVGNGSMTGCAQPAYRYVGIAPLANFIEVKTDFSDAGIIDGVNYIFQKAAALGKDAVVNLSLGGQYGPHDGSDAFPVAVSGLTGPGRIVVASAGNDQEDHIHGKLTTTSTTVGTDRFTFTVPTYTQNVGSFNDYVLITGWYDPTASYTIRLKGPLASDTLSCGFGQSKDRQISGAGKVFIANQHALFGYGGTSKGRQFEIEIYDSVSTVRPRIGTWEIDVVSNGAANIGKRVDVWIYASQLGPSGVFSSVVIGQDNTTLVGSPADGDSVFAVAAHATKGSWFSCAQGGTCSYVVPPTINGIASFSCVGPRRDGVLKPEISAPGFGVATTHSNQAGGIGVCGDVDDGVHIVEAGTSFSAPHVAAAASLFLSAYPGSSPSRVKQAFQAHARTDGFTGAVPNPTWGYGKLDIYGTFDHAGPTVALTSPNGGESWAAGSIHNITWSASDFSGVTSVDLLLSTDGGGIYATTIAAAIPNTGSYAWTLPAGTTATARVRVTAKDAFNNLASAASAANFAIVDGVAPTVAIVAPNGGEQWAAGSNQNILWTASDNLAVTAIDLAYSTDGGSTYPNVIATGLANSGTYNWTVPGTVTTTARVRVTASDGALNSASSASANDFAIVDATPPTVAITAPAGGGQVEAGVPFNVTFTAGDNVGVTGLDVEYSADDGANWAPLATGIAATSPYAWSVPAALVPQAKLRTTVHDAASNTGSHTTDAFSIVDTTPPAIALLSPNGGEFWLQGDSELIDWSATDLLGVDSVRVEYSVNGANGPWNPVATVAPDTSGFAWTVPVGVTDSALVRVTAFDGSLNEGAAVSADLFHIVGTALGVNPTGDVSFALLPPMPNPGRGGALLRFRLPFPGAATLEIYTPNGQRVWTSGAAELPAGESGMRWDGRDAAGARAGAGIYFVRLTTPFGTRSVKMVRLP